MFPVVLPVAGWGTRSLPASKAIPKEMLPLFNKPIIQYVVEEAKASGVEDVIFVTSKGKSAIEDHFDVAPELEAFLKQKGKEELLKLVENCSRFVSVQSVRQKEALGLGHAVWMAKNLISSSHFFVSLGDEVVDAEPPALAQLLKKYEEVRGEQEDVGVVMVMEVADEDVPKYGICEEVHGKVRSCVEKPKVSETNSRLAITGRYLLPRKIFSYLEGGKQSKLEEFQLTDALDALAKEGLLYTCKLQGYRMDAGDRMGFLEANLHYYLQSNETREASLELLRRQLETNS